MSVVRGIYGAFYPDEPLTVVEQVVSGGGVTTGDDDGSGTEGVQRHGAVLDVILIHLLADEGESLVDVRGDRRGEREELVLVGIDRLRFEDFFFYLFVDYRFLDDVRESEQADRPGDG